MLTRLIEHVRPLIASMLGRGYVTRVNDARRMQALQLRVGGQSIDEAERFQQYGLTSHPEVDAEVLVACLGGSTEHAVAIAVDDRRHRPTGLAAGEVQLYSRHGQFVKLKANGAVEVVSGSKVELKVGGTSILIEASGVTITSPAGVTTFT